MVADTQPEPGRTGPHLSIVAPPPENRLGGNRPRVMMPATIVCPDGVAHACVIRNMSPAGAKLAVSSRHPLPLHFTLVVPGSEQTYPVTRKWQRGDFAGVALGMQASPAEAG